jgi:D-alanine-D-alanine ligase
MLHAKKILNTAYTQPVFIWVLAPHLVTEDENLDYYYDFTQSIAEYTKTFATLGLPWQWQPVTMQNYAAIIDAIAEDTVTHTPIVLNLCDGDEVNGTPGISVVKLLAEKGLIYTGADEYFYNITTSKIDMKLAFDKAGVPTPPWQVVTEQLPNPEGIFEKLGYPVIVKPAVSGGSMGVGVKSVVSNIEALTQQVKNLYDGYRGWSLTSGGVIAEAFIDGPEFTVFIVGSYNQPQRCLIYPPVERVFHPSLPNEEKFLSFDRLWEIYEDEASMPNEENFYEYQTPDAAFVEAIKTLSWDAYVATGGKGYTRVDIRMDKASGNLYVLEVNAQCGISEDENFTSIGAILRLGNCSFSDMVVKILNDGIARNAATNSLIPTLTK